MLPEPLHVASINAASTSPAPSENFSPPAAFGALSSNSGSVSGSGSSDPARRKDMELTAFPTEEEGPLLSALSLSLPEVRVVVHTSGVAAAGFFGLLSSKWFVASSFFFLIFFYVF